MAAFNVIKMDIEIVNANQKLWVMIENRFCSLPIELSFPILDKGFHVIPVHSVPPIGCVEAIG